MRIALRKNTAFAVAAVAALAFSLTACNDGDGTRDSGAAAPSNSASGSPAPQSPDSADSTDGKPAGDGQSDSSGGTSGGGTGDSAATGNPAPDTGAKGECVNTGGADGCYTGTLNYLADHKMTVGDQEFLVENSTRILGAAAICGGADGSVTADNNAGTTPCTYDQLVTASKTNSVTVRVVKDADGVAATVTELYHP
ncbi:hypothetical protein [Streptomyces sp. NPDC050145]|uniref:hypothetical protein n=1 Tax=Streptomyces sp. NPDC050145 TaxID=3365602 RepID=UPI0037A1FEF0